MSLILVDMDGVLCDWGAGYGAMLDQWPVAAGIPRHKDQKTFNLKDGLNEQQSKLVDLAMSEMDYYELKPMPGAVEAVNGMLEYGHDVVICTSPWLANQNCVRDKLMWADSVLGKGWSDRVIITKDKTMVLGDILIDDKPQISGRFTPEWQQIVFDQPYNKWFTEVPRMNSWAEWSNENLRRLS